MADDNAGIYVGVAVIAIILIVCVLIIAAVCYFKAKQFPDDSLTAVEQMHTGTIAIKSKALKLKAAKPKAKTNLCCCHKYIQESFQGTISPPEGLKVTYSESSGVVVTWIEPASHLPYYNHARVQVFVRSSAEREMWTKTGSANYDDFRYVINGIDVEESHHIGIATKYKSQKSKIVERPLIISPTGPPQIPTNLTVSRLPENNLLLTWRPPLKAGQSAIDVYDLMVKDVPSGTWASLARVKPCPGQISYKVKSRANWKLPLFKVAAENSVGKGPYLESDQTVSKDQAAEDHPAKPGGKLRYSNITHNSVKLSWRPSDGGSVTEYIIERRETSNGEKWRRVGASRGTMTSYYVTTLPPLTELIFQVTAKNDAGISEPLVGAKITTKDQPDEDMLTESSFRTSSSVSKSTRYTDASKRFVAPTSISSSQNSRKTTANHRVAKETVVGDPLYLSLDSKEASTTIASKERAVVDERDRQNKLKALNKKFALSLKDVITSDINTEVDNEQVLALESEGNDSSELTLRDLDVQVHTVDKKIFSAKGGEAATSANEETLDSSRSTETTRVSEKPTGAQVSNPVDAIQTNRDKPEELFEDSETINNIHCSTAGNLESAGMTRNGSSDGAVLETATGDFKDIIRTENDFTIPMNSYITEDNARLGALSGNPSRTRFRR